jgi:hypothetical protein
MVTRQGLRLFNDERFEAAEAAAWGGKPGKGRWGVSVGEGPW